jgi:uncharacterized protein (DUF169 family)
MKNLKELLGLRWTPVAISFRKAPPPEVLRVEQAAPAGCQYWRLATEGAVFYTTASDHHGCVVGSHTHSVDLPPEKAHELRGMVAIMVQLQYIQMEEVPSIPRLPGAFGVAIYSPLDRTPCDPDVVLIRGNARQVMLVAEAARLAGIGHEGAAMGRPACAMIPAAIEASRGALSLGCIGNRVYTGLGDDELYYAIPGPKLPGFLDSLETILNANRELENFHQSRLNP